MSPDAPTTPAPQESDAPQRSPLAGCSIFILAGLIMIGLVGWTLYTLNFQAKAIAGFTDETPKPTPLAPTTDTAAIGELETKLRAFSTAVQAGESTTLTLTTDDLNLAIATYDRLEELRETFYVQELRADGSMLIQISFPLGKAPFKDRINILNGTMEARPLLIDGEPILRVEKITPSRGEVPAPFLEHFSPYRLFERYMEDDQILSPILAQMDSLEIKSTQLIITADPDAAPVEVSEDEFKDGAKRTLLLFMSISSIVLMLVVIAIVLKKRRG